MFQNRDDQETQFRQVALKVIRGKAIPFFFENPHQNTGAAMAYANNSAEIGDDVLVWVWVRLLNTRSPRSGGSEHIDFP